MPSFHGNSPNSEQSALTPEKDPDLGLGELPAKNQVLGAGPVVANQPRQADRAPNSLSQEIKRSQRTSALSLPGLVAARVIWAAILTIGNTVAIAIAIATNLTTIVAIIRRVGNDTPS